MLSYIRDPLVRTLIRQAYGPMWLADGDCVLVNRLLMEAIADRAVQALMNEDGDKEQWDRTAVVEASGATRTARAVRGGRRFSAKNDSAAEDGRLGVKRRTPKPDGVAPRTARVGCGCAIIAPKFSQT